MVGSGKPVNFEVRNQMHAELTLLNLHSSRLIFCSPVGNSLRSALRLMNLRPSGRADLEIGAPIWIRDRLEALSYAISG